jgi:RimJ/RimL family protein N-acetyltransferase
MVGHAGFHLPPRPLAAALSDPSFEGDAAPATGGVVEIGYTILPADRRRGYAVEAVGALVTWALEADDVSTVLASVATDNEASHAVLRRVGGFRPIGTCRDDDGTLEVVYRRDRRG